MEFDKIIKQDKNKSEIAKLQKTYKDVAEKILSEFGPEGAYEISDLLKQISDEDMMNGMNYTE